MRTFRYVLRRLWLGFIIFFIILAINFSLIKLLEPELPMMGSQAELELARREALGYNKPIPVQFGILLKNVITENNWGYSWKVDYMAPVSNVIGRRLWPTIILNIYSMIFSLPLGIVLGIIAAIYKNKWVDHFISTVVVLFISIPSFVFAFVLQYTLGFRLGIFPVIVHSIYDAGGSWFTWKMFVSMVLPILSLSFGTIAGYARTVRAELSESLTSEYMLLARTKGLTHRQALWRHALKNAMVPILPGIISSLFSLMSGSMIIESIFAVNGIGKLYIQAVNLLDYDVFVATGVFYSLISILAMIVVDLSYGFLDPRIRVGER